MIHELKIHPEYFKDVTSGKKPFEIRKRDRDFKVGDYLALNEYSTEGGYTGKSALYEITYVMIDAEYVKEGFAVLGVERRYIVSGLELMQMIIKAVATHET